MASVLATLGASVVNGIISFFSNKAVKTATLIGICLVLVGWIPFKISLPNEVMEIFESGSLENLFMTISYFVPISYLLVLLGALFAIKYTRIWTALIGWVLKIFVKD